MTTLIGIVAQKENPNSVVIASDLQTTFEKLEDRGDVVLRVKSRTEVEKIDVDDARNAIMAGAGMIDSHYNQFLYSFKKGEFDLKEITEKGYFPQFLDLHIRRFGGKNFNSGGSNQLLLATRYDGKPKLWGCYPLGHVEELPFAVIGSGGDLAREYFAKQNILSNRQLNTSQAIDLAANAIGAANTDIYTSGLNLAVVTSDGIKLFGEEIRKRVKTAEREAMDEIKKTFSN